MGRDRQFGARRMTMRICSLLPSGTEILYSLGLGDQVVAVTHECDYPPETAAKPRITEDLIEQGRMTSIEIDHHVSSNIGRHGTIYRLKQDLLETLEPDLIVTQELCEVCAVSYKEVLGKAGLKSERITPERILEAQPEIIVLMPCGFSLERTVEEYRRTRFLPGWSGQLYAVDGSSYFNRSGPRLIDGVEILSEIFHPSVLDGPERGENRLNEPNRNFKKLS